MNPIRWPPFCRLLHRPLPDHMRFLVGLLAMVTLAFGSACAKQDWIDRTLVTVDVTGAWQGTYRQISGVSGGTGGDAVLVLQQRGAKVTGEMKLFTGSASVPGMSSQGMQIEGAVSGDTFTFHEVTGAQTRGEFQVNGDEMIGSWSRLSTNTATLRRQP
jgi:hypothetical protein